MVDDGAKTEIAALVGEHHASVYRYAFRLTGSVPDAEDLTQQVFLTAQQKFAQLRNEESARSWLFAILRNCFFKSCQKRVPQAAIDACVDLEDIAVPAVEKEVIDQEQLQKAIQELSPLNRLVLAMFYYEDLSYRQIADRLEIPIGTVMSRLARAKAHLRARLFDTVDRSQVGDEHKVASHRG